MNWLPIHPASKQQYIPTSQDETRRLPVQFQQTLVRRFQEHVGEVLPQCQRCGVGEQTLAHDNLGTGEVTRQDQFSAESVGERGHGFDDLVDDRRRKGPREIAGGISREGQALREFQSSTAKSRSFSSRYFRRKIEESLELVPIGLEMKQLITRSSRRRREVALAHTLTGLHHVVAHGGPFDINASFGQWPDCVLNLFEGEYSIMVHSEVSQNRAHRITRQSEHRRDGERSEHVDTQQQLIVGHLGANRRSCWSRSRRWLLKVRGRGCWRWLWRCTGNRCRVPSDDVHGHRATISLLPPPSENYKANQKSGEQGRKQVHHTGEGGEVTARDDCATGRGTRGGHVLRDGQMLRELQSDSRGPTDVERHQRSSDEAHVLTANGVKGRDDNGATSVRDRNREVVRRVDQSIIVGVRVVELIDGVQSRHRVAAARSRQVAKGRSGQWRHARKERSPVGLSEIRLNRARAHLQREVDLSSRRVDAAAVRTGGIKCRRRHQQHTGITRAVAGIDDGYLVTLGDLVERGVFDVVRAGGSSPRQRKYDTAPHRKGEISNSRMPVATISGRTMRAK